MQALNDFLSLIDSFIGSSFWFPYVLIGTGLFFTIYLKFPQIRYFNFAIKVLRGKFQSSEDEGDTSHFQALTTALLISKGDAVSGPSACRSIPTAYPDNSTFARRNGSE